MPTIVNSNIQASGGAYIDPIAFEDDKDGDLVVRDTQENGLCKAETFVLAAVFLADGSTTDATRFMKIMAQAGDESKGSLTNGPLIQRSTSSAIFQVNDSFFRVQDIGVESTTSGTKTAWNADDTLTKNITVERCVFFGKGARLGLEISFSSVMRNCIFLDGGMEIHSNRGNSLINCTMKDGPITHSGSGSTNKPTVKNCVTGPGGSYTIGDWNAASTNNSGPSGTTPPGDNALTDVVTGDFEDFDNDDLHMMAGASFADQGVNLTSDFTDDIDLETRPSSGNWDRGADEVAAVAGAIKTGLRLDNTLRIT